ncbi:MAG: STAS domain-containing protein [Rhodobacteraceae bacterium]|nr:STAS domain-containing protein [Paracoccaceae bacterium]
MPHVLPLPARLDVDAACTLWDQILQADGDLHLDAASLDHLGAAGLQVLLAAQRRQHGRGQGLALLNVAPDCAIRLAQLGAADLILTGPSALPGGLE